MKRGSRGGNVSGEAVGHSMCIFVTGKRQLMPSLPQLPLAELMCEGVASYVSKPYQCLPSPEEREWGHFQKPVSQFGLPTWVLVTLATQVTIALNPLILSIPSKSWQCIRHHIGHHLAFCPPPPRRRPKSSQSLKKGNQQ